MNAQVSADLFQCLNDIDVHIGLAYIYMHYTKEALK